MGGSRGLRCLSSDVATDLPSFCNLNPLCVGEAATGIATLIAACIHKRDGVPLEVGAGTPAVRVHRSCATWAHPHPLELPALQAARRRCFLFDSKGLVVAERLSELQPHKRPFAHAGMAPARDLLSAVRALKPTALIGVSAVPGAFTQEVRTGAAGARRQAGKPGLPGTSLTRAVPPYSCAGGEGDGAAERAAAHLPAVQPHAPGRVHL